MNPRVQPGYQIPRELGSSRIVDRGEPRTADKLTFERTEHVGVSADLPACGRRLGRNAMKKSPTRTTAGGVVVVAPRGRIDLAVSPDLQRQLLGLVHNGHIRLLVDLSDVELIDSSGLGALVTAFEAARDSGGDLEIMSPREQVALVLELTNLHRVLRVVEPADDIIDG